MKITVKILACFSLTALSTVSLAGTVTFSLQNDTKSVKDPIVITQGHVEYQGIGSDCSKQTVANIAGVQASTANQTTVPVNTSAVPSACWQNSQGVVFRLVVDTVDNKKSTYPPCEVLLTVHSPDENVTQDRPLTIFETSNPDGFICHLVPIH